MTRYIYIYIFFKYTSILNFFFNFSYKGFAVSLQVILSNPKAVFKRRGSQPGMQESDFLRQITTVEELEPKANNCTKVLSSLVPPSPAPALAVCLPEHAYPPGLLPRSSCGTLGRRRWTSPTSPSTTWTPWRLRCDGAALRLGRGGRRAQTRLLPPFVLHVPLWPGQSLYSTAEGTQGTTLRIWLVFPLFGLIIG